MAKYAEREAGGRFADAVGGPARRARLQRQAAEWLAWLRSNGGTQKNPEKSRSRGERAARSLQGGKVSSE
jgi:hypothetical protein